MSREDEQLRARIGALGDAELGAMLTRDADNYREEALVLAREEAARRRLDLGASAIQETAALRRPSPNPPRLARLWPWSVILAAAVALEIAHPLLGEAHAAALYWGSWIVGLTAYSYYLVAVNDVHEVLGATTGGSYPITAAKAVGMHFIPLWNLYWVFRWGSQLSRFVERHGTGRRSDRYIPGVLFLLSLAGGSFSGVPRILLLFVLVWHVNHTLSRDLLEDSDTAAWSSEARG